MTAAALATRLEVSERTIHRDVDALGVAGIPVYAERGSGGGIRLSDGYRRALTQFGEDEIRALFIASANPLADIGLGEGLARALEKLAGALPPPQRRAAERSRSLIFFDPRRWKQPVLPVEHLAALRRAVWDDRRVMLRYRDSGGKHTERVVEPLGLVAKAGVWYFPSRYNDEMRVFRCDRVLAIDVLHETFERPTDFDLAKFWQSWSERFEASLPKYPVRLRVAPEKLDNVTGYWEAQFLEEAPASDGWSDVRVIFPSLEMAVPHLVAWADSIRIVEPAEVLSRVLACARAILADHEPAPAVGVGAGDGPRTRDL
ncbi:MAG: YafY family transcriptional regulator [Candidatus Eremiobacteraeota bacterium]|nr:YafY family transcriptional regulator [Candidatus Eremiobacteraeota bacterium]